MFKEDERNVEKLNKLNADEDKPSINESELKYQQLSWQKLTVCLIVEAIALGSLSIPSAFAAIGMIAGVIITVGLGVIAIYTSYVVGQVQKNTLM